MLVTGLWTCSARVKVGGARAVDGWHIGRDEWCDGCGWVARDVWGKRRVCVVGGPLPFI